MPLKCIIKKCFHIVKGAFAATIILAVSPTYIMIHTGFRLVSLPLSNCCFVYLDDTLWDFYQKFVLFFFEHVTGAELVISGEIPSRKENVVLICNHQCTMDWIVTDMLAVRQSMLGHLRYVFKDSIKYIPLFGYAFGMHGGVYIKRDGTYSENMMKKVLKTFKDSNSRMYFVVFPEGTRFSPERKDVLTKSRAFAISKHFKPLTQVLTPRVKAFYSALVSVDSYITAVYDATIVYDQKNEPSIDGLRPPAPSIWDFLVSSSPCIHICFDRIPIGHIPTQTLHSTLQWLHSRFEIKDALISRHYVLPQVEEDESNADGRTLAYSDVNCIPVYDDFKSGRVSQISLTRTLPPTVVLIAFTAALLSDRRGRKLYFSTVVGGSILGLVYAKVFF